MRITSRMTQPNGEKVNKRRTNSDLDPINTGRYNPTTTASAISHSAKPRQLSRSRRDALVCDHLQLVAPIARAVRAKLPARFDLDDLESAGRLGLMRAAGRYRPRENRGVPFEAFARPHIRGAIADAVRREWSGGEGRHALKPLTEPLPCADDFGCSIDGASAIEDAIDGARRGQTIRAAVETLPAGEKRLLQVVYAGGAAAATTVRAAAALLGISPGRAYRLHNSGVTLLRARFAAFPG
jgi:RNA polymerase sigma factor (sigma-70 family)